MLQQLHTLADAEINSLRGEVERLSVQIIPSQLLHPQARLQWVKCADIPLEMSSAQAVVMGEKVYVGGGVTEKLHHRFHVFQYNTLRDEWGCLPPHHVLYFAMAQFKGHLVTVGGGVRGSDTTGKVYRFKETSQEWEEFLQPMPTDRCLLTVATTQSAITAIGGIIDISKLVPCATVEVYSSETSQWYTADPLPTPYHSSSVTIADICYLLGGGDANTDTATVLHASLTPLVQRATSPTCQSASHTSVWKTLPDTPLMKSVAGCLSGSLLAVGGHNNEATFPAINVFFSLTNSWVKIMTDDLPEPRDGCTTAQLSSNIMIVIGGKDNQNKRTKTVFMGIITV